MSEGRKFTYCAYCGEQFPADGDDSTDLISEHIATCPKHPMREAEARVAGLEAEIEALRGQETQMDSDLRAAYAEIDGLERALDGANAMLGSADF